MSQSRRTHGWVMSLTYMVHVTHMTSCSSSLWGGIQKPVSCVTCLILWLAKGPLMMYEPPTPSPCLGWMCFWCSIRVCDMTRSSVWYMYTCETRAKWRLMFASFLNMSFCWNMSFRWICLCVCVYDVYMSVMLHSYVWHDSFVSVAWLIRKCDTVYPMFKWLFRKLFPKLELNAIRSLYCES